MGKIFDNVIIYGNGTSSGTYSLTVHNSTGTSNSLVVSNSGNIGIGSVGASNSTVYIGKNMTNSTSTVGVYHWGTVQSGVTVGAYGFRNEINTQAASFTITDYLHFFANQGTIGVGSTVSNQYGFRVGSFTGAVNNYGFYAGTTASTGRWNIYMAGDADNYFAGNVGIGTTTPDASLDVNGRAVFQTQTITIGLTSSLAAERVILRYDSSVAYGRLNTITGVGFSIGTGGVGDRMVITSAGLVGIGNSSPTASSLVIGNGSTTRGSITLNDDGTNSPYIQMVNSTSGGRTYNIYSGHVQSGNFVIADLNAGNVDRFIINSSGNVSIGSTYSFSDKLYVAGSILVNYGSSYDSLLFDGTTVKTILRVNTNGSTNFTELHSAGSGIIFKDNANNEQTRMDNNGNWTIGSTYSTSLLSVVGTFSSKMTIAHLSTVAATAPTTIILSNYLQLGGPEYGINSYRLIGFGYMSTANNNSPSYIGYKETSIAGHTQGDLVFGTRATTTDVPASEVMRISSQGNVGIGTTSSSAKLEIQGTNTLNTSYGLQVHDSTGANNALVVSNSGNIGIGILPNVSVSLYIGSNITGAVSSYGVNQVGTVQSTVTSNVYGFRNDLITQASSFTLGNYYHFIANQNSIGAGSTVSNQNGFYVPAMSGATNNYGFRGLIASSYGDYNLYMQGTADNFLQGNLGIATNRPSSGPILTVTLTNGGTGYVDGTYTDVALTAITAAGVSALATLVITGGTVSTATLTWGGSGYTATETLSVATASVGGGTGSGFILTVATVDSSLLRIAGSSNPDITLYRIDTTLSVADNIGSIKFENNDANTKASGIQAKISALGSSTTGGADLVFYTRNSTAGSLLTESMRIMNNGNVVIGTASTTTPFQVYNVGSGAINTFRVDEVGPISGAMVGFALDNTSASADALYVRNLGSGPIVRFSGNNGSGGNVEQFMISNSGNVGVGTVSNSAISLYVNHGITGSTTAYGVYQNGTVQSGVTGTAYGFYNELNTKAASFVNNTYCHFIATQGTIGAGSTVSTQYGYYVGASVIGGTNNYGFYGGIASGTNRWNLYMGGTADNHFAGNVGIGVTTPTSKLHITDSGVETTETTAVLISATNSSITSSVWKYGLRVNSTGSWTGSSTYNVGVRTDVSGGNGGSGGQIGYYCVLTSGTVGDHYGSNVSVSGGSGVSTNNYGYSAQVVSTGGANYGLKVSSSGASFNYGIEISNPSSSANNYSIYSSATAKSYFNGDVGIGQTSPTAVLHLKAGTATANTAPLKFTTGALLTTAEAGAVEFNTDSYYATITTGTKRRQFAFINDVSMCLSSTTASTTGITTSNTIVVGGTASGALIPANTLVAGSTFRITLNGRCTSTTSTNSNFYVRIGTTGLSSDSSVMNINPSSAASGTNIPFTLEMIFTVASVVGTTTTILGSTKLINNGTTGIITSTVELRNDLTGNLTFQTFNSTVNNVITVTYQSGSANTTTTFTPTCSIEQIKI